MSTTRGSLLRRRRMLLALTFAAVAALFAAYVLVHGKAASLRDDTAPAILDVTAAQNALIEARQAADTDPAGNELVDTGGGYRVQIEVAIQSLARAAEASVRGESGLRTLATVTGLIVSYTGWLERANQAPGGSALRAGCLSNADHMLYGNDDLQGDDEGILDRLDALQKEQTRELDRQASFDLPSRLAWAMALLFCAALAVLLVETQVFLWRRFRRRFNLALLGATVLLVPLAALIHVTVQTQTATDTAREGLAHHLVDPWPPSRGDSERTVEPERVSVSVQTSAEEVDTTMSETDRWDGLAGLIPVFGLSLAGLTALGLWPRIDQYRSRRSR